MNGMPPLPIQQTFFRARSTSDGIVVDGDPECRRGDAVIFAGWEWDGERLVAEVDRYGMYPMFVRLTDNGIELSHSLAHLVATGGTGDFNFDALAVFIRIGWFVGEDTPFRDIEVLPPGGRLEWRAGRVTRTTPAYPIPDRLEISFEDAVVRYVELFRAAVRRSLESVEGPVVVPLSGGKDSRHVLGELSAAGVESLRTLTFQQLPWQEQNLDTGIATAVAHRLGVPHSIIRQPLGGVGPELRKNVWSHFCSDEHLHYVVLRDRLSAESATIFDGIGGDTLSESKDRGMRPVELMEQGRFDEAAELELGPPGYFDRFISSEYSPLMLRDVALHKVSDEMRRHAAAANPWNSWRFWSRTRREVGTAPFGILCEFHTKAPYLDPSLFDFLASLPARLTMESSRLHSATIRRALPDLVDIPFDHERRKLSEGEVIRFATGEPNQVRKWLMKQAYVAAAASFSARSSRNGLLNRRFTFVRSLMGGLRREDDAVPWMSRMSIYLAQLQRI